MAIGLSKEQTTMVAALLFGTVLVVLNQTFMSPALPTIMNDMGVDATTVQFLTSAYMMTESVVIPLSAYLMGRFSTRQLFIGGFALFLVGTLVAAFAPVFPLLLLGRVLQACATGVVMPMVFTLVLLIFPREKRGTGMGLTTLIIGFAPAVGPSLSGLLVDHVGWRALFGITATISVAVLVVSFKVLKNFEGFERSRFDLASVILSTIGMVSLLYGLSTFTSSDNLPLTLGFIVVGIVVLGFFARRQLKLEQPLLNIRVLKSVRFRTVLITVMLIQSALVGLGVIMPLFVQGILGYPATVSGLVMLPGAVLGALMGMMSGRLFDKVGVRPLVLVGSTLMCIGACGLITYNVHTPIWLVMIIYSIMTLAMQSNMTPMNTWAINSLENENVPHANALQNTMNQVAGSFGTALIVSLSALGPALNPGLTGKELTFAGYHISYTASACILFLVVVIILVFVRNATGRAQAEQAALHNAEAVGFENIPGVPGNPTVADCMDAECLRIPSSASVAEAMELFSERATSGLPIVDDAGMLVGFIADGDIMRYLGRADTSFVDASLSIAHIFDNEAIQQNVADLMELNVMSIATTKVLSVNADTPLKEACNTLAAKKIKKVPVVDTSGKVVGSLSRRDVIHAITNTAKQAQQ